MQGGKFLTDRTNAILIHENPCNPWLFHLFLKPLKTNNIKKVLLFSLGILLVGYLLLSTGFYLFQDRIIFQPQILPKDYVFKFEQRFEEYFIKTDDGETLNALLFRTENTSKGLILYFHGNADNLQRWGNYAVDFTSLGYDVLMIDYRGYGKSTGTPDENKYYEDALIVWEWSKKNIPNSRLIIYGRSLGSAIASNLATKVTPDLLILETPFDDITGAVYLPIKPILYFFPLHHHFPNKLFLRHVSCKKIIFHGTKDMVVPLSSAMRLKSLLAESDQFIIIEGGGHRDLRDFEAYREGLAAVLR